MYVNCFWISGQYKGKGYSNMLLDACIEDSKEKEKKGLVILSAEKKMPYLSDPKYLKYKGFTTCDTAMPNYELMYLPFEKANTMPKFKEQAKNPKIKEYCYVLYYTKQCPFTAKYVPLVEAVAKEKGVPFKSILLNTKEQAQNAPIPFTSYSIFYNGEFLTNEILSEKKFEKIIDSNQ